MPSFRLVPTQDPVLAGEGRLEYTADPEPSGKSLWGKVCSDCFNGSNCATTPPPSTNAAAHAICKDLGFATGEVDTSDLSANDGVSFFALDDVTCPSSASSFGQCSGSTVENCSAGQEVYLKCVTPEAIVIPKFEFNCGPVADLPFFDQLDFLGISAFSDFDLNDDDINNPFFVQVGRGEGQFFAHFTVDIFFAFTFRDNLSGKSHGYQSADCPTGINNIESDSWSFEIKATSGRIWVVTGSFSATASSVQFAELVFRLK